jgi:Tfp pilus assembly protein PilF
MSRPLSVAAFTLLLGLPLLAAEDPLVAKGVAAIQAGDDDKAIELLKEAVAHSPKSAEAHYHLGDAYGDAAQKAGLFSQMSLATKCKEEFETAVALDPNHLEARMGLLEFYLFAPGIAGGSVDKARAQAEEIRKRDTLLGHHAMARIYNYEKKPDLARAEYAACVKEQPASPKARYLYGSAMIGEKKYDQALAEFETSIKLDANYMPGWFQIGHMAALTGKDMARGEEALKRYLNYKPAKDEPGIHRAHYWLGGIYEKQGKKAEAKAEYTTSLKINPKQKDVQEALKRVS